MNKKEIAEIKKQYNSIENCSVTQVAGCYVDGEGNVKTKFRNNFLALPEEVIFKYLEIFRKCLSGKINKNLLTLEFPMEAEGEDGQQYLLLKLRDCQLKNDELLDVFYDRVISVYQHSGNYLILLIHNVYDIPGKASDNSVMEDASEEVYSYITCAICPVELSKAGLSYSPDADEFTNRDRDWVVKMPEVSFTFPAFNDRNADIHSVLYYEKKGKLENDEIMTDILGCSRVHSAEEQQAAFSSFLQEMNCSMEEAVAVHEKLNEMLESTPAEEIQPMGKQEVERLLQECLKSETLQNFDEVYDKEVGSQEFVPTNITNARTMEIKGENVVIKIAADRTDIIQEKVIDGRKCIVITVDGGVEVNGTEVHAKIEVK